MCLYELSVSNEESVAQHRTFPLESRSMKDFYRIFTLASVFLLACDPPAPPEEAVPSGDEIRQFMGLVDGNCWRYRRSGTRTYLNMSVSGPNTIAVAGRSLYVREWLSDSGDAAREEYFDLSTPSELRIAREKDGRGTMAEIRSYTEDPLPLVGKFQYGDEMMAVEFAESIFKTFATPMDLMAEDHQWTVINTEASAVTHDGMMKTAIELSSQRGSAISRFTLVPGYGYTKFTDTSGQTYQICDACIGSVDGECTETQCRELKNCE